MKKLAYFFQPEFLNEPKVLAFRASKKIIALEILILILSGLMTSLAFPGCNQGWLIWFSAVPLIVICRGKSKKYAFVCGCIWGYFWNLAGCFFLREIMFWTPWIFGAVLGVFSGFWSFLVPAVFRNLECNVEERIVDIRGREANMKKRLRYQLLIALTLSCWWVVLDWIRSWIFTGFPWGLFPASQWKNITLIQICEYTGIYGVDFLLIFGNFAVFFLQYDLIYLFRTGKLQLSSVVYAEILLFVADLLFGFYSVRRWSGETLPEDPRIFKIGVVQPHLSERRDATQFQLEEALARCSTLSAKLFMDGNKMPELVVWPETAVPDFYYLNTDFARRYRAQVRTMLKRWKVPFLLGTMTFEATDVDSVKLYNSALLVRDAPADPQNPYYDRQSLYSKVHLVPFGEYIPFNDEFPKIGEVVGMGRNLTPGNGFIPQKITDGIYAGTVICYEDVFPYTTALQARNGANFLLVITNDAWYPTSFEPEQHCANSIFRTIETRLPMVRCGNSNYSVLIDVTGKIIDSAFRGEKGSDIYENADKKTACSAVFHVPVPQNHKITFYTRYGIFFIQLCAFLFLVGMMAVFNGYLKFRKAISAPVEEAKYGTK